MSSSAPFEGIRKGKAALILAPMEGVTDWPMRDLLTSRGGFDFCVSEFIRVSQDVLPARVFLDHVPELKTSSRTRSGVPVMVQLLGGDPGRLAQSALRACEAGALGIDLNFGCPAQTVNRHDGGATLLKYPHRIEDIVRAVRDAVPRQIPVSAKLRLGWDTVEPILENAQRAEAGGADWITVHGRTKMQGYAPPAHWEPIALAREKLSIPVVANGDIWTIEDFRKCRDVTGCEHFMIGRSALTDPSLPLKIASELGTPVPAPALFGEEKIHWSPLMEQFAGRCAGYLENPSYAARRIKQWLRMAHQRRPFPWFDSMKRTETLGDLLSFLAQ